MTTGYIKDVFKPLFIKFFVPRIDFFKDLLQFLYRVCNSPYLVRLFSYLVVLHKYFYAAIV